VSEETSATVVGRYGTAVLSAQAPAGVRERVLAALGGSPPAAAPVDADDAEQTVERPEGTGLLKTGVWEDPDYAPPPPETDVRADSTGGIDVAPTPAAAGADLPEPAPGTGRRRRRPGSPAVAPDTVEGATAAENSGETADGPGGNGAADVVEQRPGEDATQALAEATAMLEPESPVPLIPAAMCAAGHPNPPDAAACQACAAPLTGEIRQVPRPVLAVLTVSTGQTVPVRGKVVVGRAPRPRPGEEPAAELVTVPSPTHFVSRSHLEVSVAGWSLLAQDLGSANGTVLVRAGAPPVLLATALPTPLLVGDLLDVGDGVTLRVDPPL